MKKVRCKMMENAKRAAAEKAATLIQEGQTVGLGTGSTARYFIEALNVKNIRCVASSRGSAELAKHRGLKVLDINEVSHIDITVDGADQITHEKEMIKGGGGAHTREKILAYNSKRLIIIVDESKVVKTLTCKLPVEVLFYGSNHTGRSIGGGKFRLKEDHTLFLTDNGNLIYDIEHPKRELAEKLKKLPGVVDTGFFFGFKPDVIVGKEDGTTTQF